VPEPGDLRTRVWRRVRQTLTHLCGWVWRQGRGRVSGGLARGAAGSARTEGDGSYATSRTRFWNEFREGQREAEARGTRLGQ
jgi:hypothetical protein